MGLLFLLIALTVMIVPSHFISLALYRKLVSHGYRYAMGVRVSAFIISLGIIATILLMVISYNMSFER